MVREGLALTLAGVACGLALSIWVGRALRHQLYGVSALDVPSLVGAAVILIARRSWRAGFRLVVRPGSIR